MTKLFVYGVDQHCENHDIQVRNEAAFWILNGMVRIRILLFRSLLIRVLPFKLNHLQLLSVHNGTAVQRIFKHFMKTIISKERCIIVTKDELDHFEENFSKDFLSKRSDSNPDLVPVHLRRILI
jgi:hypothetical protein